MHDVIGDKMKIGIFDSGLGGMVITRAFLQKMPEYDYFYYGDSKNLPYGEKTSGQILAFTLDAMKFMIKNNCKIIIIACNTATSITLRYIQQRFLPTYAPDVKVLGVVIPTVEIASQGGAARVGVVATSATVRSHIYQTELHKINPNLEVFEKAAPELVPAIERNDFVAAKGIVKEYSAFFEGCDSLILGCTHYPLVKDYFRYFLPKVRVVSQDELMGDKLFDYLQNHPEIKNCLSQNGQAEFVVSSLNAASKKVASNLFGDIEIAKAKKNT